MGLSLAELTALKVGDFVVHEDHGVGVYRGLQRLTLNGQETDCVELAYAEKDRLYVPVHQLGLVSRYAAEEGARPALHRLGSVAWQKTKSRARRAIQDMADALIKAYAARRALPGTWPDTVWQRELEPRSPQETPDRSPRSTRKTWKRRGCMDRLMRRCRLPQAEVDHAAFKAVRD